MKVYLKLLVFLSALLCVFGLLALWMIRTAEADVLKVQHELERREGAVIDNIMELKGSDLQTFAWDYSWWQDLIDWMEHREQAWLEEQFEQVLYTYGVDFFAVYDASGKRMTPVLNPELTVADVILPEQLDAAILTRPRPSAYEASFERSPEGMLEICYAPVMPQEDADRTGPHFGYLVAGRFWDEDYIDSLESVTGATMSLVSQEFLAALPSASVWTGTIQLERPLYDYTGELEGRLLITKYLPVSKRIVDKQGEVFGFMLTATLIAIFSLGLFVVYVVTRPLKHLSSAMESGDVAQLCHVRKDSSEFKHLAELIIENYEQRERLEVEVSKRIETEAELKRSRDRAECASRAKSQFLANMSHETRTQLHTISGYAALLEESDLNEDQKQSLAFIRSSSNRLVQMLTDIIELSSLKAEAMRSENSWFELSDLFDELIGAGESFCAETSISFRSEYRDGCPKMIYSDYDRLRRVLLNLVDNAIKFTPSGTVAVRCDCTDQGGLHRLCIEVEDTGIGIPQDELDRVFDAFHLVDDSDSREYQGGGLGLAIAKGLSGILQAELEVESIPGEGSVFRLVLMLAPQYVRFEQAQAEGSWSV